MRILGIQIMAHIPWKTWMNQLLSPVESPVESPEGRTKCWFSLRNTSQRKSKVILYHILWFYTIHILSYIISWYIYTVYDFFHITNYVYHMLYMYVLYGFYIVHTLYISGDLLKQGVIPYTTDVELLEEKVPAIAWEYIFIYYIYMLYILLDIYY